MGVSQVPPSTVGQNVLNVKKKKKKRENKALKQMNETEEGKNNE